MNGQAPEQTGAVEHTAPAGMDKEYFEYYFETIPDRTKQQKAKLEYNLIRIIKREIKRKDPSVSDEMISAIKSETIKYEKLGKESYWLRGIKDIFKFIKYTDNMYIVKYDKYLVYMSFEMDPALYIQPPFQVEVIFKGEDLFENKVGTP